MEYSKVCSNCVMDTSDRKIVFDSNGVCDHCNGFRTDVLPNWHPNEKGMDIFRKTVS